MYGRSRGYGGYRSGYGNHHMSMAHRRLMEELGQAAISTINRPTPNHCSNNNSKELQHTNKQAINHSMLNKHIRKLQVHNNMHKQTEERARTTSQPLHLINIRKKTVNKTVNVNQQPRRSRWGLGGFRSMWHIPMIFMFWRGFSRNRHQPQPQPQPQPQQNEPVNIANINILLP